MKFLATAAVALGLLTTATLAAGNRVTGPAERFSASGLKVENVAGTLTVDVKPTDKVSVQVSGAKDRLDHVRVYESHHVVHVTDTQKRHFSLFDWHSWFSDHHHSEDDVKNLKIHVTLPDQKLKVDVHGFTGNARIGNTHGPLTFKAAGMGHSEIGDVGMAEIAIAGTGNVRVGRVAGDFSADIAGNGTISAGDVGHGLNTKIAGQGKVNAASVHGPVNIKIAGQGWVKIAGGEADPFQVKIAGQGDVAFNGVARNPQIRSAGMAKIRVKKYIGKLDTSGKTDFAVGVLFDDERSEKGGAGK